MHLKKIKLPITGHLDIFSSQCEDEYEGEKQSRNEVLIHGDPEGLRSFAKLLLELADLDQETAAHLPVHAREHVHLRPGLDLAKSSDEVIVGHLDARGTGQFYERYISK